MSAKIFVAIENLRQENAALRERLERLERNLAQLVSQMSAQHVDRAPDDQVSIQLVPIPTALPTPRRPRNGYKRA